MGCSASNQKCEIEFLRSEAAKTRSEANEQLGSLETHKQLLEDLAPAHAKTLKQLKKAESALDSAETINAKNEKMRQLSIKFPARPSI